MSFNTCCCFKHCTQDNFLFWAAVWNFEITPLNRSQSLYLMISHYFTVGQMCRWQHVHRSFLVAYLSLQGGTPVPFTSSSWHLSSPQVSKQHTLIFKWNAPTHVTIGTMTIGEIAKMLRYPFWQYLFIYDDESVTCLPVNSTEMRKVSSLEMSPLWCRKVCCELADGLSFSARSENRRKLVD